MIPSRAVHEAFLLAPAMPALRRSSSAFEHIAARLIERSLAVHHACIGLFAKFFNPGLEKYRA